MVRSLLTAIVVTLVAILVAGAQTAPAGADPAAPPALRADLDGNKVFDDLEARLAQLPGSAPVSAIVRTAVPATPAGIAELARSAGRFPVSRRFELVDAFAARLTKLQIGLLASLPTVLAIEENSVVRTLNDGAQSSFGVTKARADAPGLDGDRDGNPSAYSKGDLVAAVIDTGIDVGHVDLDGGKVIGWKDFVNGRTTPYDDNGHGTHVAGTIAGTGEGDVRYKGVAPAAGLVGIKVLDDSGSGTMDTVTAAIEWAVANKSALGIEALNLSLGSSGCSDGMDTTSLAVNAARDAGLVVVVAAGNAGPAKCTIGSPGAASGAITAGAMTDLAELGFRQASFSSRGPTADGRVKPDISAPGVRITSATAGTSAGYVAYSGTSMATPFVAGVALLMLDAKPSLTPGQVRSHLTSTAVDWGRGDDSATSGSRGTDVDYGAGRLDAYAALKAAGAPLSSGPPVPAHRTEERFLSTTGSTRDYAIDVTDTRFPIAATLVTPSVSTFLSFTSGPNFNLALYDPSGSLVASTSVHARQDDLGYLPTATGSYRLQVRSISGGGGDFFLDTSAGTGGAPPPPPPPPADTTPPSVVSTAPAAGASSVAVSINVAVAFSEPMDKPSAQGAFSLVRSSDSAAVSGSFSWSGDTMTFDPTADLAAATQYTAKVTAAAKDLAGNALPGAVTWTFTTASASPPPPPPPPSNGVVRSPDAVIVTAGTLRAGSASSLAADDGSFLEIASAGSLFSLSSDWHGSFAGVPNGLKALRVSYAGKNSASCSQTVAIWRWTTSTWVTLDSRSVGPTEVLIGGLAPSGTLADYVSGASGDGEVRVRVACSGFFTGWVASGDLLRLVYEAA